MPFPATSSTHRPAPLGQNGVGEHFEIPDYLVKSGESSKPREKRKSTPEIWRELLTTYPQYASPQVDPGTWNWEAAPQGPVSVETLAEDPAQPTASQLDCPDAELQVMVPLGLSAEEFRKELNEGTSLCAERLITWLTNESPAVQREMQVTEAEGGWKFEK